jgi:DNA (cytosine-5)-methyltransferase 1
MNTSNQKLRVCELFAGIGGFRLGIEQAFGKENVEFVFVSEWDKYAAQIYERNFNEKPDTRDIREVQDIPDHDLLTAGFPCQSFSIAGKRGGFEDTRGTLFFEIARIAKQKQPRLLLLENVKGLLSHDKGKTFGTILNTLDELGYDLQWQVLNSKNFGVPQNRERVFIVGHLRGTPRPEVFPIGKANGEDVGLEVRPEAKQQVSPTIGTPSGGHHIPTVRYPLKFMKRNQRNVDGDHSFTVDGANTGGIRRGTKIRRLTPTECERLQGFPDGWTEGISDTQRYKCLGNAVTTNVVYEIGKRI